MIEVKFHKGVSKLYEVSLENFKMATKEKEVLNIKNLFNNGGSLELAIATFKDISESVIRKIYEEVMSAKTTV